mgnify:CR=1 FL=1
MTDTILVPVELPDPGALSPVLVSDLSSLSVVVLGHYQLPEQTPTNSGREQFEADAEATLQGIAERFSAAGASVRTRLVFGKDRSTAISRVADEEDCVAELVPAPTEGIDRILVPIPDVPEFERLPRFIDALCEDSTQQITVFHAVEDEESRERGESIVGQTRDELVDAGFDTSRVDTRTTVGEAHDDAILRIADEYDAVVMYTAESRLGDRLFGTLPDRIKKRTGDPVITVRRDY